MSKADNCSSENAKSLLANYQWLAEDYPPYNFRNEAGELVGIFTDVLVAIYDDLGLKLTVKDIDVLPWARLYYNMENYPKYAAFSMVNAAHRQKLFKLVPLPTITKVSILVLEQDYSRLARMSLDELSIAVVREDIGHQLLNQQGIGGRQVETSSAFSMLKMLLYHRVDAISYSEDVAKFQIQKLNIAEGVTPRIVPLHVLDSSSYTSYVFHRDTPNCVITLFSESITRLEESGTLSDIWQSYLQ